MTGGVLRRMRYGVPADELRSPFDGRSAWAYRIIAAELAAAAILIPSFGFNLSSGATVALPVWAFLLCAAAMLLRRYGHTRVSAGMEAIALVYGKGFAALFLLFPLTAISLPLADFRLALIDHALGFEWTAFANLFAHHAFAQHGLVIAYHSFDWQPLLVVTALCLTGRISRCWNFVIAGTIAGAVTTIIFPFVPAMGTFVQYHVNPAAFPWIFSPWQFGKVIVAIKSGARTISPEYFTGFVSFPSYHAAAGAIFTWAMWPFRWTRWAVLVLNFAMFASALIVGGHYFCDLLGGFAVGTAAIVGATLLTNWSGEQDDQSAVVGKAHLESQILPSFPEPS